MQLYTELPPLLLICTVVVCTCCAWLFRYLPVQWRFKQAWLPGILLQMSVAGSGALLLYKADMRHQQGFFQNNRTDTSLVLLQIEEPLQPKARSFKSTARVIALYVQHRWMPAKGNLLLYIARDTMRSPLVYGDLLVVRKKPELIRNNGNPGGFNYQQYCVSQQLYQQLYLQVADYYKLSRPGGSRVNHWLLHARDYCLSCFRGYIGAGAEAGMADALLIGYRQDREEAVAEVQDRPREDFFIRRILRRQTFRVFRSIQTPPSLRSAVRPSRRFRILARWRRTGMCYWSLTDLITTV